MALTPALAIVGAWTLFGVLASAHFFLAAPPDGRAPFAGFAEHIVVFYWGWALLTPAVAPLARVVRGTAPRDRARRRLGALLVGAVAVTLAHGAVYLVAMRVIGTHPQLALSARSMRTYLLRHGGGDIATYLVLVGAFIYRDAARRSREREVAAAALQARLARADLELLRWQLQPHFLFNALNAVSTLVLKADVEGAERAIALVARYLRSTLREPADAVVPLAHELRMAERYVEIEALRFGARLRLECAVGGELLGRRLPSMILQPVVENAIRHGFMAPHDCRDARDADDPYVVVVSAWQAADRLLLTVRDPARAPGGHVPSALDAERVGAGFGLRYVRERLEHHYGRDAHVALHTDRSGTVATIDLPAAATIAPAGEAFPA